MSSKEYLKKRENASRCLPVKKELQILCVFIWKKKMGGYTFVWVHCKKRSAIFPSPAGMSLTKISLAGNNKISPGQGEFGKWQSGWGRKNRCLFYSVSPVWSPCTSQFAVIPWIGQHNRWPLCLSLRFALLRSKCSETGRRIWAGGGTAVLIAKLNNAPLPLLTKPDWA
jgi:hypothetical protein